MCKKLTYLISFALLFALVESSAGQDLDPNLVGWWKLDEGSGTTAADSSGNGNDGTLNGDPQWVAGFLDGALQFDGTGDEVSVPYSAALNPSDSFTVSAWANVATGGTGHRAVVSCRDDYPQRGYIIYAEPGNTWQFWIGIGTGWNSVQGPSVQLDEWDHVAAVYSAGTQKFYINGVFAGQASATLSVNAAQELLIGTGANETASHNYFFVGAIDDVRVYNRELTAAEIKQLAFRPKARKPDPPDGAPGVTVPLLSWTAGDSAAFHDVYLGTAPDLGPANRVARNPKAMTVYYHGAGLEPGTTYYWRIDEVEVDGVTIYEGDVWSFTAAPLKAWNPIPPDGAAFQDPDVDLTWTPGATAMTHDVYFGTDETAVADGTGDTFKTTLADTTFDPGTLALETTYYWRIDEVEQAGAKQTGDVWSFSTMPIIPITDPNLVGWWKLDEGQGSTAIDWSGHGNHGTLVGDPQWADGYDGDALSFDGAGDSVNFGTGPSLTGTIDFTVAAWIKTSMTANGVIIQQRNGGYNGEYRFMVTPSGTLNLMLYGDGDYQYNFSTTRTVNDGKWHHAVAMRTGGSGSIYVDGALAASDSGTLRNLDGTIQTAVGADIRDSVSYFNGVIDDVRIYTKALTPEEIKQAMRGDPLLAWNPSPINGSVPDIDGAIPLSWQAGDKAAQHDVYLGTDETAVKNADASDTTGIYRTRQAATTYTPLEALQWGQTYYWRIDEVNTDATITTGKVWTFTVASYLIPDDFETYDDYCNRIFYAWKDGWGHSADPDCGIAASGGNGTGSTVGNLSAPFAEQTIVHGGIQSMPFEYDNSGATGKARYSEAQREWAVPQDWTKGNVKALTLWFHGETGNTPETLYVALEDNAGQVRVATHPNPEALQGAGWQEWNIALQQFSGVNLASVKKMYLGVGNRNNPQAGGSGKLYIDDIRVYPARCVPSLAKPAADLSGNCIVDYADVEIVSDQWLNSGFVVTPTDPGNSGLIAHYPFNGNANDVVGGHNGTTSGMVTYGAGKIGQAIILDGVDDLVTVGSVGVSGAAARTISGWVKANATIDSLPNWINIFGFTGPSGGNGHFDIEIGEAQGRRGYVVHVYGWERVICPVDLEWHHLAASYDGTTIQWYGDGRLIGSDSSRTLNTPDNVHMGKREDNDNYFPGRVDEVRIFDRALSDAEVASLAGHTSPLSIPADLYQDDVIDFKDLAVLGDSWLDKVFWP